MTIFTSTSEYNASLEDSKESYTTDKMELWKSLAASEEMLESAKRLSEGLEHIKDSLDESGTKIDEADAKLKGFAEGIRFR